METVVFNQKSWHYKLATKFGGFKYWRSDVNLCDYVRSAMAGGVWLFLIVSLVAFFTACVGDAIAYWAASLITRQDISINLGGAVATVLVGMVAIFWWILMFVTHAVPCIEKWWRSKGRGIDVTPRFLVEAYETFKTKTCRKVDFK